MRNERPLGDGRREALRVIQMNDACLDQHTETVTIQLTKGGIRLGLMLTEALNPQ